MTLEILFEDEDLLLLNKKSGDLVEGSEDSLEAQLQHIYDERVRALHRLDKGTSGVLAFSLRRLHHSKLVQLWEERRIKKIYWALVQGFWKNPPVLLEGLDQEQRPMKTRVKVLSHFEDRTLVQLELETGRKHQARLQCSQAGYPIVGDTRYGAAADELFGEFFALHARSLSFEHPVTKQKLVIEADLPQFWRVIHALR